MSREIRKPYKLTSVFSRKTFEAMKQAVNAKIKNDDNRARSRAKAIYPDYYKS